MTAPRKPPQRQRQPSPTRAASKQSPGGARALAPGLYVVATPIGNARDITLRALDVLTHAGLVLAEDTRVTAKLFALHGLAPPMMPCHEHNMARIIREVMARLGAGAAVALVSDAGTPLVSDPGGRLVRAAIAAGHKVIPVPGPSAALAALTVAGLPTDSFFFAGFLPAKAGARMAALEALAAVPATLVFYESPRRLAASLKAMAAALGDRPAAVARELTKKFEEVRRGGLGVLAAHYAAAGAPKGEVVVVVGPPSGEVRQDTDDLDAALESAMATLSLKDAVAAVAGATGAPRKDVYARALALRKGEG